MAAAAAGKLKLLCLHGYMQNAEIFRSRLGSMRKALKSRVEFVFLDAPFEAQGLPGSEDPEEVQGGRDGRSWWQWTDSGPSGRPSKAANYTGWEVSQAALVAAIKEHSPDGLLGFSQGATAAALLLAHLASPAGRQEAEEAEAGGQQQQLARLKCAVLVAGFLPRDPAVAALVAAEGRGVDVPLLFVSGTSDSLVPPERTAELRSCFPPAVSSTFTHGGAHLVPTCSGEFKSTLVGFLDGAAAAAAGGPAPAPLHRVASAANTSTGGAAAGGPAGGGGGLSTSQSAASLASASDAQQGADAAAAEGDVAVAEGVAALTVAEPVAVAAAGR